MTGFKYEYNEIIDVFLKPLDTKNHPLKSSISMITSSFSQSSFATKVYWISMNKINHENHNKRRIIANDEVIRM